MKKNKKIFLIDFDDVLFNTKKFREDMIMLFSKFGVTREVFYETYKDFPVKHRNNKLEIYDPEKQFRKIKKQFNLDTEKLKKEFYKLVFHSHKYVFSDVKKFLEKFKDEKLYIISYGKNNLQRLKIMYSGIDDCFQKIIITNESKEEAVPILFKNRKIEKREIFFFDDRARFVDGIKKKYPSIKTFLVKRKEGRYDDKKTKFCDFEIKTLGEAEKIIMKK